MFGLLRKCIYVSLALALAGIFGCRAEEAAPSGFIQDPGLMARDASTPFQRTYWNKKYDSKAYDELIVANVDTHYVMAQNFWESASTANVTQDQIKQSIADLAAYTRRSFMKAAEDDPKHRFKIVDKAGPKTLILELALVQVVPSKPALNAIGYVSWVPTAVTVVGSAGSKSEDYGKGVVAIEGRIRDGASGEIIGMFADRERPPVAIVDVKALQWWAPAQDVIDQWAKQLIALANRPPGGVVKEMPAFELLVW